MRLGVLRNRNSTGNRGRPAPPLPPGTVLVETDSAADCRPALDRLHASGTEAVVVDGGDGTVRAVVSHLGRVFGAEAPLLAILASGNTNLVARRMGALRGAARLARLAGMAREEAWAQSRPCPALRIAFADGRPAERGFIAGWGAYAEATRIGAEEIATRRTPQVAGAVVVLLRRSLAGPESEVLRQGVACDFRAEGCPDAGGRRFLGIVTTLSGPLMWPLDPFWGDGEGAIRWLDICAPPPRLAIAAPFVAIGRPLRWMARAGYRSGRGGRVELALDGEIVVDGERLVCGGGACITAESTFRFVH
jgi:hypothetical protein